jgi:hypothetical protein
MIIPLSQKIYFGNARTLRLCYLCIPPKIDDQQNMKQKKTHKIEEDSRADSGEQWPETSMSIFLHR